MCIRDRENSDKILSGLVNDAIGFGYPNSEELQLGVTTKLKIDEQIKNQTKLSYTDGTNRESLPTVSYTHLDVYKRQLIKCIVDILGLKWVIMPILTAR